jgi:hypothetical protein
VLGGPGAVTKRKNIGFTMISIMLRLDAPSLCAVLAHSTRPIPLKIRALTVRVHKCKYLAFAIKATRGIGDRGPCGCQSRRNHDILIDGAPSETRYFNLHRWAIDDVKTEDYRVGHKIGKVAVWCVQGHTLELSYIMIKMADLI